MDGRAGSAPDYQASATVISESHGVMKMMAITNEAGSDDGRPQTLGPSREYYPWRWV